jgi:predicted AAA+ superfamily ATPase
LQKVVLTGARQAGKSTLLLNAEPFRNWRFHTLDDYEALAQVKREPGRKITPTSPASP